MRGTLCVATIIVALTTGIFAGIWYSGSFLDVDNDFIFYESGYEIAPEGTKEAYTNSGFSDWTSYEGSERIDFIIDNSMAKEIGKSIITSTVWNTLKNKKLKRVELMKMFRYKVYEMSYESSDKISLPAYRIVAKPKIIPCFANFKSILSLLEKYNLNCIEVVVNKSDGRVLEFTGSDLCNICIIDERCGLDIATTVLKNKGTLDFSDMYNKDKKGKKCLSKRYVQDTYGIVFLVSGCAHDNDDEQEYYSIIRTPRFSDEVEKNKYTFRPLEVLVRKADGKIEKCWLTEFAS